MEKYYSLIILGVLLVGLAYIFLIRIYIAYILAKHRHRDPIGWVLLSFFISPLLAWIVLVILGEENQHPDLERLANKAMTDLPPTDYKTERNDQPTDNQ